MEQELRRVLLPGVELTPVLGDAGDSHLLKGFSLRSILMLSFMPLLISMFRLWRLILWLV